MDGSAIVNPSIVSKSNLRRNILIVSIILLILASGTVIFFLTQNGGLKSKKTKEPTVTLTKDYDNPFDKSTQYTNPFSEYKNPFDNLVR